MHKTSFSVAALVFTVISTFGCSAEIAESEDVGIAEQATGNGAPSGAHYGLNIIGMSKDKTADMTNTNGQSMFVPLDGTCKINLTEGPFDVIDRNGTDANGATFQLPNPDPENDGITVYSVFARALGKPGGGAMMTTCATDPTTGEEVCSLESVSVRRSKGKSLFDNVSQELLYIYADIDGDGDVERVNLFNDKLQDYFWQYDNKGLRLLQLRFYEVPTTVANP
jgi:hypothetical protein